jgi:hypothetical protein
MSAYRADRKWVADGQIDAFDPQRTSDIRSHSSGWDSHGSYRELRLIRYDAVLYAKPTNGCA